MITRENAKIMYPSFEDGNVCPSDVDKLIDKIFDSFEQHIKSIEAQLANTEHVTCDGCEYDNEYKEIEMRCLPCNRRERTNYFKPKDTQ